MPRLAVRLLLALVLCLNGFLAPVAMAAHADAAAVEAAAAQPPCHGDEAADPAGAAGHDDSRSCCQPGHCVCACVFSVSLPFAAAAGTRPVRGRLAAPPRDIRLPPARETVPLRPPIV